MAWEAGLGYGPLIATQMRHIKAALMGAICVISFADDANFFLRQERSREVLPASVGHRNRLH